MNLCITQMSTSFSSLGFSLFSHEIKHAKYTAVCNDSGFHNDHIMPHVAVCFKNLGAEDKEVAQPSRLSTTVPEDLVLVFSIRQLRIS